MFGQERSNKGQEKTEATEKRERLGIDEREREREREKAIGFENKIIYKRLQ